MAKFLFIMANEGHRWGGSEPLWRDAAERLALVGSEVWVSTKDWGERVPQVERLRSAGCKILYRSGLPPFFTRQFRKVFPKNYRLDHVQSAGRGTDLTVVSQGANWDGLEWIEAVRAARHRYAIISQGAAEHWWPDDNRAERMAACYENASAAYFVSQANVELSRRQFGDALLNARVVRNPFNVRYNERLPWPDTLPNGLSLACVARLDVSQKGQDLLLQVLSLPHWRERKIHLSLVGSGVNERRLRRATEEMQLTNVIFTGHVEDIEQIWRKHHALILGSRYEGLPLALVEAMLCGRPAIVTDVAGHKELVRDGVNGFLAKAPTVELLDEAMNRAWESRSRLQEMGKQAALDVREFVTQDPAEDFARELERVVGQGK